MYTRFWDYLIVTASNAPQAEAYRSQLELRRGLGLLAGVRNVLVVPDPGGKRIGSGGSTVISLLEVVARHGGDPASALAGLRILIVHAGGDSRRLPAYGPCGKILVPVPGENDGILPLTLFDRQIPVYLALPESSASEGQIVITSGDVLLQFDPAEVRYPHPGLIALACDADPEVARNHGVFCRGTGESVRRFLQKPSPAEQEGAGALNTYGQALLDIGVMQFDTTTAARLMEIFGAGISAGQPGLSGPMGEAACAHGLDFYREICCGLGSGTDCRQYLQSVRSSGSTWDPALLERLFELLQPIAFHFQLLPGCEFLDFGTTRKIIASGNALLRKERGVAWLNTCVEVNTHVQDRGQVSGIDAWVEGCRVRSALTMPGENVVVGVDVDAPLTLPRGACLDIMPGRDRHGQSVWFVRPYHVDDTFKAAATDGATFCGIPILKWLTEVGAGPDDVWPANCPRERQTVWNARLFPACQEHSRYQQWIWMVDPGRVSPAQRQAWLGADRYSLAEVAELADRQRFERQRAEIRAAEARRSLRRLFRSDSGFSATELGHALQHSNQRTDWVAGVIAEACEHGRIEDAHARLEALVVPRILHTLGDALLRVPGLGARSLAEALPGLADRLEEPQQCWLRSVGLELEKHATVRAWAERGMRAAFDAVGRVILASEDAVLPPPRNALRSDEIVWGRAPARLDTGGGWTDTPPYALEHGGAVVNTAVNLNGQPPIQAYARVIDRPVIRIGSIDLGTQVEIAGLDELLDYRHADSQFALVKAALALAGFSPQAAEWPTGIGLDEMLRRFGGGIELTTLAAIPKGSGLGTSSIMGAVILAVIHRVLGRELSPRELFHGVLRLEQALTTGGGWQDQVGGVLGGTKLVTTSRGLIPDPRVHYLPADVIDPDANGGRTLLYYTGVTRLAKNILEQVVGRYLSRDRRAMATLKAIRALAPDVSDAISRKDIAEFGRLVEAAWTLNKELDPNSTNAEIEALLDRIRPHVLGAKLLGAGAGGFLLMVCRSTADARTIRTSLGTHPPNPRARFFDFSVNTEGLVVTVC